MGSSHCMHASEMKSYLIIAAESGVGGGSGGGWNGKRSKKLQCYLFEAKRRGFHSWKGIVVIMRWSPMRPGVSVRLKRYHAGNSFREDVDSGVLGRWCWDC